MKKSTHKDNASPNARTPSVPGLKESSSVQPDIPIRDQGYLKQMSSLPPPPKTPPPRPPPKRPNTVKKNEISPSKATAPDPVGLGLTDLGSMTLPAVAFGGSGAEQMLRRSQRTACLSEAEAPAANVDEAAQLPAGLERLVREAQAARTKEPYVRQINKDKAHPVIEAMKNVIHEEMNMLHREIGEVHVIVAALVEHGGRVERGLGVMREKIEELLMQMEGLTCKEGSEVRET